MKKINQIQVNGITYEIGGSESVIMPYYLSIKVSNLSTGASTSDIDIALGGTGDKSKVIELYNAVRNGNLILLKNEDGCLGGTVNVYTNSSAVLISFNLTKGIGSKTLHITNLIITKILSNYSPQIETFTITSSE